MRSTKHFLVTLTVASSLCAILLFAQNGNNNVPPPRGDPGGPPRFGPPGGVREETKLVKQFDKNGDKILNSAERKAAREFLLKEREEGRGRRPFGFRRNESGEAKPGPKVSPSDVKSYPNAGLYDPQVIRTFFLTFEDAEWEKELADFKGTDVEVPAKLEVDGKTFVDVGVHFRGMSSFGMVS